MESAGWVAAGDLRVGDYVALLKEEEAGTSYRTAYAVLPSPRGGPVLLADRKGDTATLDLGSMVERLAPTLEEATDMVLRAFFPGSRSPGYEPR